jgi:DNA-binding CsgD family transcriptional regulator
MLGEVSLEEGDLVAARAFFEDSLAKARETKWGWGIALALVRVAHVAIEQGDQERARAVLAEGLAGHRAQGNRAGLISCIEGCAHLEARRGHAEQAVRLADAAAAMRDAIHAPLSPTERHRLERWLAPARGVLGHHPAQDATPDVRALPLDRTIDQALASVERILNEPAEPRVGAAPGLGPQLTPREQEVLALVAQGHSNLEIAERLVISERTVESHVRNMLGKLRLSSRIGLAVWAVEHRLDGSSPAS